MSLDQTDPTFLEDLRRSDEAVERIATWLRHRGRAVIHRPLFERPSPEQRHEYADGGDLEVLTRVEVKRRTIEFSSQSDFPWPSIIVDVCHAFDNAQQKPSAYYILSKSMNTAALVDVNRTRKRWTQTEKMDTHAGRARKFYECPVDLVKFINLADA